MAPEVAGWFARDGATQKYRFGIVWSGFGVDLWGVQSDAQSYFLRLCKRSRGISGIHRTGFGSCTL